MERTESIFCMFVTLDVSKLSGWLNADALCQVGRRAYDAGRSACWEGAREWGGGVASGMYGERARPKAGG